MTEADCVSVSAQELLDQCLRSGDQALHFLDGQIKCRGYFVGGEVAHEVECGHPPHLRREAINGE